MPPTFNAEFFRSRSLNIHHESELSADNQPAHAATQCPGCNATATGNFCANCGETLLVHRPSAAEFLHEFVGHFVALEGKLVQTLYRLMCSPGRLTKEYLRGKRVAYINPLRLYLTLSLLMFALIKVFGIELPRLKITENSFGITYSHSIPNAASPNHPKTATLILNWETGRQPGNATGVTWTKITVSIPDSLTGGMDRLLALRPQWTENFRKFMNLPAEERSEILNHGFLANLPYMLIGAVPVFALYLKVIYLGSGRYYGEYLVFALHTNALAFLIASLMILIPGNAGWAALCLRLNYPALISTWDWVQFLPLAWLIAYLPLSMNHIYGGSRLATLIRWLVLITAHLAVIAFFTVISELIGIIS
jgi:hypothetical protein